MEKPPIDQLTDQIETDQTLPEHLGEIVDTNIHKVLKQRSNDYEAMERKLEAREKEATTDHLTRLLSRRGLEERVAEIKKIIISSEFLGERREHSTEKKQYAILIVDIDHFKSFNTKYGHPIGDEVLKMAARYFEKQFRPTDIICRWGGEEFVILLENVQSKNFLDRLNKSKKDEITNTLNFEVKILVRKTEDKTTYRIYDGTSILSDEESLIVEPVTFSGGLVSFSPKDEKLDETVERADGHLYEAKKSGRNQIIAVD